MRDLNVEQFKSVFQTIADLVSSLDEMKNVILKPRREIENYLEGKPLYLQENIINQLIELSEEKAISELFLSDDRIKHGQKVSFEHNLKIMLKTVKSQIQYEQLCLDNRIIQNIKDKVQALNSKSAKINFLLEKKRDFEGDYPQALGKHLKKDNLYLFLERELQYWEKYHEISDNKDAKNDKTITQLQTNLSLEQRENLYDLLVNDEFILKTTNKEGFIWAFGPLQENQPKYWQPIIWKKNKQLLRELLTIFKSTDFKVAEIEKTAPLLFKDEKDNPIKLAKNKVNPSIDSDKIIEFHKKIATI